MGYSGLFVKSDCCGFSGRACESKGRVDIPYKCISFVQKLDLGSVCRYDIGVPEVDGIIFIVNSPGQD